MKENSIENNPEKIPTKQEVLEIISRYEKNTEFTREKSDDRGLYLLEARDQGEKAGQRIEYEYRRKGKFDSHETTATEIHIVYYKDGIPYTSDLVNVYNSETGEWKDVRPDV